MNVLPSWIGGIRKLVRLNVQSGCEVVVPREIFHFNGLPKLTEFRLQCRRCDVPQEIFLLNDLRKLYLDASYFQSRATIPEEISNLTSLEEFTCLWVKNVPAQVWQLPNLKKFTFGGPSEFTVPALQDFSYSIEHIKFRNPPTTKWEVGMLWGENERADTSPPGGLVPRYEIRSLKYYAALNKAGRRLWDERNVPDALWAPVLGRWSREWWSAAALYYCLKHKPALILHAVSGNDVVRQKKKGGRFLNRMGFMTTSSSMTDILRRLNFNEHVWVKRLTMGARYDYADAVYPYLKSKPEMMLYAHWSYQEDVLAIRAHLLSVNAGGVVRYA